MSEEEAEKTFWDMSYEEQVAHLEETIAKNEEFVRHPSVLGVMSTWVDEMELMKKALAYLKETKQRIELDQHD